ncbi:MAG TPA: D-alanyl-D-alanine carboxypeptidase [Rhizomicrobium sp.]|nr:D-alanyl-D-alanine carboxypeptidase [Rhizomicrobium sp.]
MKTVASLAPLLGLILCLAAVPASAKHHHRGRAHAMPASLTDPAKDAALIVDGASGKVLYSRNANAERHPASLTKMMTLYLLFEALRKGQVDLATDIPVSAHAAAQKPTKLHLSPGDRIPVEAAINAIVVRSANDVAVAVAEALGGTESHFCSLMNEKARQLGMRDTFYHNASGLPDNLQISTASDLAILARHLSYDFPEYYHYFGTPGFTYRGVYYATHDNLIGRYAGADGIKTGYTGASGFNLVSSVTRGRTHVIGVVMGGRTAQRRDREMMRLLDNTFAQIRQNPTLVASAKVPWQTLAQNARPVTAGFDLSPPAARPGADSSDGEDEDLAESQPDEDMTAPQNEIAPPAPPRPAVVAALAPRTETGALPPPPHAPTPTAKPAPAPAATASIAPRQPSIVPKPKPGPVMVASIGPPALRPSPRPEPGEGDVGDDGGSKFRAHDWTIQIGAFANSALAKAQLASYAEKSMDVLGQAARIVVPFKSVDGQTLFRARFGPFAEREARAVCAALTQRGQTCFAALATR